MLDLAEDYDHGITPDGRGSLDQAQAFLDAVRFIRSDRATWTRPPPDSD